MTDTPKSSSSQSSTPAAPQSKQYIAAAVDDDRLEPDAMRGSEHLLQNVPGLENLDKARTEKVQAQTKQSA